MLFIICNSLAASATRIAPTGVSLGRLRPQATAARRADASEATEIELLAG